MGEERMSSIHKPSTTRTIHEVDKTGNLYFLLNGFNGAINRLATQIGGGLQAIALALSTPHDNSGEVKALTERLRQQTDALQSAIDQASK